MPPLESRKSANNLHMLAEVVTIEGQLSAQAIEDPSAPPLPLQGEATPGDVVAASVETDAAGARVRIVLAPAGSLKAKFYRIVIQHGLDPLYPDAVHRETHELDIESMLSDPDLEDLDHLPFVTIDNRDSRDLDQALFIERNNRDYIVWYALADAAAFVRPGSALFEEALRRGSSFYLPGLTLPMLPRRLSEDWISLNENRCRRAFVFKMEIDSSGLCRNTRLHRARIRSRKKLSYPRVQRAWDDPGGSGFSRQPFQESLELLREVGRLRLAEAKSRHVVQYNRREVEVIPADDELGFAIIRRQRLEVESCNEQISLLCNIEGARL
ncbi:MAG: RNB domain-containing ribonuclease, partial [bacterium]|nr:RNB domain-containing ribonuclease [bacterium]